MNHVMWHRTRQLLISAALVVAGVLGVAGIGLNAVSVDSSNSVAVECPPEKERC